MDLEAISEITRIFIFEVSSQQKEENSRANSSKNGGRDLTFGDIMFGTTKSEGKPSQYQDKPFRNGKFQQQQKRENCSFSR